jgi:HEPN domain-containing protein
MKRIILACIGMLLFASLACGQSLLDNADYRKAKELQRLAEQAMAEGDYDQAYAYSQEAKEYVAKAQEVAVRRWLQYRAHNWNRQAADRLAYVKAIGGDVTHADAYNQASQRFEQARQAFEAEDYEQSITYAQEVMALLADVKAVPK